MDKDVFLDIDTPGWWLLERDTDYRIDESRRHLGETFGCTDTLWYLERPRLEELHTFIESHNWQLLNDLDNATDEDKRKQWIESVIDLAVSQKSAGNGAAPQAHAEVAATETKPNGATGTSLPLDREFVFERGPFPAGPLLITVAGGCKFKGTIAPGEGDVEERIGAVASTKGSPGKSPKDALKLAYEKKVAEVFGQDLKFTAEREQGKGWKIGGQLGGKEWAFKLAGQLDPTKPVSAKVSRKWKDTWHIAEINASLIGEFELAVDIGFGLNPAAGAAAAGAAGAATEVTVTSTLAGEACTVSVLSAAAIAVVAGAAVVAAIAVGMYMIGSDLHEGKMQALGNRFADGYAEMITDLSADPPKPSAPDSGDWIGRLEKARSVASGQDASYGTSFATDEAYQCGRTAIYQDVMKTYGSPEQLSSLAKELRAKYGEDDSSRLDAIRNELYGQVKAGGGAGIGLAGVSSAGGSW